MVQFYPAHQVRELPVRLSHDLRGFSTIPDGWDLGFLHDIYGCFFLQKGLLGLGKPEASSQHPSQPIHRSIARPNLGAQVSGVDQLGLCQGFGLHLKNGQIWLVGWKEWVNLAKHRSPNRAFGALGCLYIYSLFMG